MSRDLVSALYETVWTVNPENDNLEALGSYLCQMVNQLCRPTLPCRLHLCELPAGVRVSSHTRHHMTLAVKEAVHNVIKHAQASEIVVRVVWAGGELTVSIQDNGCGFAADNAPAGHGLSNMKPRLAELGGACAIESQAGRGTTVELRLATGLQTHPKDTSVHAGGAPMSSQIARQVVRHFHSAGAVPEQKPLLSPRERQVLELLSTGYIYKEIADKLDIGVETVRTHVKSICQKMHARNRLEAVARHHASLE